jgi:hypothetical protein
MHNMSAKSYSARRYAQQSAENIEAKKKLSFEIKTISNPAEENTNIYSKKAASQPKRHNSINHAKTEQNEYDPPIRNNPKNIPKSDSYNKFNENSQKPNNDTDLRYQNSSFTNPKAKLPPTTPVSLYSQNKVLLQNRYSTRGSIPTNPKPEKQIMPLKTAGDQ